MVHFHQGRNKGTPKQYRLIKREHESKIKNIKWITYNVQMTSSSRYRKWTNIKVFSTLEKAMELLNVLNKNEIQ